MRTSWSWVRGNLGGANLAAGAAVGAFMIPQAMAYGQLAGVPVAAALAVAAIPLLVYPLLGRHRWLSMGPESAVALMAAATAAPLAAQYGIDPLVVLAVLSVGAGGILLAARLARAAVVTDLLSKPVLTGYLTGIALLMVLSQAGNITGAAIDTDTPWAVMQGLAGAHVNWTSVAVTVGVVAVIVLLRWINRRIPGILIALVAAIPAGYLLQVATVGDIVIALPSTQLPVIPLEAVLPLLAGAAAIALVSYTDVIVTARAFSDGAPVNPNRELSALAACQIAAGAAGGYPVSASSSRTAIARDSHATSRFYSWAVAFVVIAAPLAFGPLLEHIPKAALAGIVVVAAYALIDKLAWSELRRLRAGEVAVAAACAVGVVTLGILPGVLIAVALSVAELLVRLARPHDAVLGIIQGLPGMHDVDDYPDAQTIDGVVVFRYDAPLFFANANNFYNACLDAADTPGCQWLVLNVESNVEVDSTGLDAIRELHQALRRDGKRLVLARVKNDMLQPMRRYGLVDLIGQENIHPTLPAAIDAWMQRHNIPQTGPVGTDSRAGDVSDVSPVHRFARIHRQPGSGGNGPLAGGLRG